MKWRGRAKCIHLSLSNFSVVQRRLPTARKKTVLWTAIKADHGDEELHNGAVPPVNSTRDVTERQNVPPPPNRVNIRNLLITSTTEKKRVEVCVCVRHIKRETKKLKSKKRCIFQFIRSHLTFQLSIKPCVPGWATSIKRGSPAAYPRGPLWYHRVQLTIEKAKW